jgi:MinD-like ATPase involved in chromosome partitioning or flagellar assembly
VRKPDEHRPNPADRSLLRKRRPAADAYGVDEPRPEPEPAPADTETPVSVLSTLEPLKAPEPEPVLAPEPVRTPEPEDAVPPGFVARGQETADVPAQTMSASEHEATQAVLPPVPPAPPSAPTAVPAVRPAAEIAFPAPESVLTVDPRLAQGVGKAPRGDSVVRRTGQSLRRLGSASAEEGARLLRDLQQPTGIGRLVAVTSIRGGVGKTTTAALVARSLQLHRRDPVLALEADAALGTLAVRLGADSVRWSCTELARILTPRMDLLDITGYLVPLQNGGWLLPASRGRVGPPLDIATYRTVTLALRRHFAVTVADCETLPGEVARTAMDTAHARIVVAPMTAEGVGGTRVVLDWLGGLPKSALPSTVVALTSGTPDHNLDLATAEAHLREAGVGVVHVPYDRHLAAGGPIETELLAESTRRAAVRLAAEAVQRAVWAP